MSVILFFISVIILGQSNDIRSVQPSELNKLITERGGKILLINVWATWCIPCREEFPDLVRLQNKYKDQLDIVALSVDYEDEIESKIIPFLKENRVKFPVFVNGFQKDEELINFFNKNWNGALPGSFIYSKDGIQTNFLEGKQSYESFSSIIENLLKESN